MKMKLRYLSILFFLCFALALSAQDTQEYAHPSLKKYKRVQKKEARATQSSAAKELGLTLDSIALVGQDNSDFEASLINYMHSEHKLDNSALLLRALELSPGNTLALGEAIEYYGMIDDHASISQMTTSLSNNGAYQTHRGYYDDMVSLLPAASILLSNGESDTRPLLMERSQAGSSARIIRLDWLKDSQYRQLLQTQGINVQRSYTSEADFIRGLVRLNPNKTVLLSPTVDTRLLNQFAGQLYSHGLCFSLSSVDKYTATRAYETIKKDLSNKQALLNGPAGMNYLALLSAAYKSYLNEGKSAKAEAAAVLIEQILEANHKLELKALLLQ